MDCLELSSESPYELLVKAALLIPISHYLLGLLFSIFVFLYHFLEIHFFRDLVTGFIGQPVSLTFNSCSELYQEVVVKCKVLHGRFSSTPWLCSPHLQIAFLELFGRAPVCNYRRQIFCAPDGGTVALDWLRNSDVKMPSTEGFDGVHRDDRSPIMVVVPGLTSDSDSAYIKHLAFKMASRGWHVVVINHRGLGGVPITSDCFYNAGKTEDCRNVIDHLHTQYPQAPLFAVGTSMGANILVKYLGEEGVNTALVGAASICSPWDLVLCDRFINRRFVQRIYNRALGMGMKGYAQLHKTIMSRLADWEGIAKSYSVRSYDSHATCVLDKFETVDTYYRKSTSASFIGNVMVPLLCITAWDDPVCTREAIPIDECRANKNVILATTRHGGHLAYFEGMTAQRLWWVRAVDEFLSALHSSPLILRKKIQDTELSSTLESSIDETPYLSISKGDLLTVFSHEPSNEVGSQQDEKLEDDKINTKVKPEANVMIQFAPAPKPDIDAMTVPVKRRLNQLSRRSKISMCVLAYVAFKTTWPILSSAVPLSIKKKLHKMWVLAYVTIVSTWPILGSILPLLFKKKLHNIQNLSNHLRR